MASQSQLADVISDLLIVYDSSDHNAVLPVILQLQVIIEEHPDSSLAALAAEEGAVAALMAILHNHCMNPALLAAAAAVLGELVRRSAHKSNSNSLRSSSTTVLDSQQCRELITALESSKGSTVLNASSAIRGLAYNPKNKQNFAGVPGMAAAVAAALANPADTVQEQAAWMISSLCSQSPSNQHLLAELSEHHGIVTQLVSILNNSSSNMAAAAAASALGKLGYKQSAIQQGIGREPGLVSGLAACFCRTAEGTAVGQAAWAVSTLCSNCDDNRLPFARHPVLRKALAAALMSDAAADDAAAAVVFAAVQAAASLSANKEAAVLLAKEPLLFRGLVLALKMPAATRAAAAAMCGMFAACDDSTVLFLAQYPGALNLLAAAVASSTTTSTAWAEACPGADTAGAAAVFALKSLGSSCAAAAEVMLKNPAVLAALTSVMAAEGAHGTVKQAAARAVVAAANKIAPPSMAGLQALQQAVGKLSSIAAATQQGNSSRDRAAAAAAAAALQLLGQQPEVIPLLVGSWLKHNASKAGQAAAVQVLLLLAQQNVAFQRQLAGQQKAMQRISKAARAGGPGSHAQQLQQLLELQDVGCWRGLKLCWIRQTSR